MFEARFSKNFISEPLVILISLDRAQDLMYIYIGFKLGYH